MFVYLGINSNITTTTVTATFNRLGYNDDHYVINILPLWRNTYRKKTRKDIMTHTHTENVNDTSFNHLRLVNIFFSYEVYY